MAIDDQGCDTCAEVPQQPSCNEILAHQTWAAAISPEEKSQLETLLVAQKRYRIEEGLVPASHTANSHVQRLVCALTCQANGLHHQLHLGRLPRRPLGRGSCTGARLLPVTQLLQRGSTMSPACALPQTPSAYCLVPLPQTINSVCRCRQLATFPIPTFQHL
jgi:hypothetical protein